MKLVQKNFIICYILSDQVWWFNVKQFLSYPKNYICKFMEVSSWHHKLFRFHLPFWIWKVWKDKKSQKSEYLENEKSFLDEVKNIFHGFKNLIKNSRQSFNKSFHFLLCAIDGLHGKYAWVVPLKDKKLLMLSRNS